MMRKKNFTLIELIVVLSVLAVLSSLAVHLVNSTLEQASLEQTVLQLKNIEKAILGVEGNLKEGYIAEMGGPPVELEDLWRNPHPEGEAYQRKKAVDGVELYCGWRGPYLQLAPGQKEVRDGWGQSFVFFDRFGQNLLDSASFDLLASLGSDQKLGGVDFAQDIGFALVLEASAVPFLGFSSPQDRYQASMDIYIRYRDPKEPKVLKDPLSEKGNITIRYYHPEPQTGSLIFDELVIYTAFQAHENFRRTLPATLGPRAVRVFQGVRESEVLQVVLRRGNQGEEFLFILEEPHSTGIEDSKQDVSKLSESEPNDR
jgi:prepilin-type N-terminal cleavage/methylation domain-containing protein